MSPRLPVLLLAASLLKPAFCGADPASAGDTPPPSVARDIEILNQLLQKKKLPSTQAPAQAAPPATSSPPAPPRSSPPSRPPQPVTAPDAAAIAQMIDALDDEAEEARERARRALVKVGPPAVPDLIVATDDPEPRVRVAAVKALGAIGDPRAAEPLAALLDTPSKDLWGAVFEALRKLGSPALPALLDALEDSDPTVRRRAVRLLGRIRDHGAAEVLIAQLNRDRSTGVRVDIAEALGKIKDRAACDALLDALHDW